MAERKTPEENAKSEAGHVIGAGACILVYGLLIALTIGTALLSYVDVGLYNVPLALAIAFVKSSLVVLVFMAVRWSAPVVKLASIAGFLWLLLFFLLTFSDYLAREPVRFVSE